MGFNEFLTKLFGNKSQRDLKEITPYVEKVKAVYPSIKELSNDELRGRIDAIKQRIQDFDTGGIAKDAEQLGQIIKHLVVGQIVLQTADSGLVQLDGLGGAFGRFFALCQCHHPFICLFVHMIHPKMGFVKRKTQKNPPNAKILASGGGLLSR